MHMTIYDIYTIKFPTRKGWYSTPPSTGTVEKNPAPCTNVTKSRTLETIGSVNVDKVPSYGCSTPQLVANKVGESHSVSKQNTGCKVQQIYVDVKRSSWYMTM